MTFMMNMASSQPPNQVEECRVEEIKDDEPQVETVEETKVETEIYPDPDEHFGLPDIQIIKDDNESIQSSDSNDIAPAIVEARQIEVPEDFQEEDEEEDLEEEVEDSVEEENEQEDLESDATHDSFKIHDLEKDNINSNMQ
jgi:hypothetical protein